MTINVVRLSACSSINMNTTLQMLRLMGMNNSLIHLSRMFATRALVAEHGENYSGLTNQLSVSLCHVKLMF